MNKRHMIISAGAPTLDDDPKLCAVRIVENDETIHFVGRVNYGVAIVGIMEEWDAFELRYTSGAREKFLGKKLDPSYSRSPSTMKNKCGQFGSNPITNI